MANGSITLFQVAAHTEVPAIACSRCDRAGRYRLDMLIARHGPDIFGIPALLRVLSADPDAAGHFPRDRRTHGCSMMLGNGRGPQGCAAGTGQPAAALDPSLAPRVWL